MILFILLFGFFTSKNNNHFHDHHKCFPCIITLDCFGNNIAQTFLTLFRPYAIQTTNKILPCTNFFDDIKICEMYTENSYIQQQKNIKVQNSESNLPEPPKYKIWYSYVVVRFMMMMEVQCSIISGSIQCTLCTYKYVR